MSFMMMFPLFCIAIRIASGVALFFTMVIVFRVRKLSFSMWMGIRLRIPLARRMRVVFFTRPAVPMRMM